MGEQGLWKLFLQTGLPELYLLLRERREEPPRRPPALRAFSPPISAPEACRLV